MTEIRNTQLHKLRVYTIVIYYIHILSAVLYGLGLGGKGLGFGLEGYVSNSALHGLEPFGVDSVSVSCVMSGLVNILDRDISPYISCRR